MNELSKKMSEKNFANKKLFWKELRECRIDSVKVGAKMKDVNSLWMNKKLRTYVRIISLLLLSKDDDWEANDKMTGLVDVGRGVDI